MVKVNNTIYNILYSKWKRDFYSGRNVKDLIILYKLKFKCKHALQNVEFTEKKNVKI